MRVILHICCQIQSTTSGLRYVNSGLLQDQRISSFAYSSMNIHLNVSPLLSQICLQLCARYIPYMLRNTWTDIRFALCQISSRSRPAYVQFCICKLVYSSERISAAIGDMSIIRCALYTTYVANRGHDILFVLP